MSRVKVCVFSPRGLALELRDHEKRLPPSADVLEHGHVWEGHVLRFGQHDGQLAGSRLDGPARHRGVHNPAAAAPAQLGLGRVDLEDGARGARGHDEHSGSGGESLGVGQGAGQQQVLDLIAVHDHEDNNVWRRASERIHQVLHRLHRALLRNEVLLSGVRCGHC